MSLTRTSSDLAKDLEQLAETTIGICVTVHRELGPGMSESVYARACRIELEASAISYEAEKAVPIRYRGRLITTQRIDLVVNQRLILEVKSVDRIHPVHVAQAVSYLRATYLRIALVVNFNVPVLKQGIRRVVLSWFVDKIPSCSSCLRDEQLPLSSGWPGLGLLPVLFQLLEV